MTNVKALTEKASGFGKGAKESIAELSRSAGSAIDDARDETGRVLHTVASSVRKGSHAIDDLATCTANRLDETASFLARKRSILGALKQFGRRHPAKSFLAAAGIGFLAVTAYSRFTHSRG